jgi:porphobilinogen deaminase
MPPSYAPRRLTIATRESALALWQAEHIQSRLAALYPATHVILLGMTTQAIASSISRLRHRRRGPVHQG